MGESEIYVSVDVETDGPLVGVHSLLSVGSAAYDSDGKLIGTHLVHLDELPNAVRDPDTMLFWSRYRDAYEHNRRDTLTPEDAMRSHAEWLESLPGKPIFVAYPVAFDYAFVRWYLLGFCGVDPYELRTIDVRSYAMGKLRTDHQGSSKKRIPAEFHPAPREIHYALEDAIEQGELFVNLLRTKLA